MSVSRQFNLQSTTAMASISTSHSGSASAATPTQCSPAALPIRKEWRPRFADDGSMLRLIVHDVGGDLHDVGVARTGCGESQADVVHRLRCLRSKVTGTDQRAAFID